MKLLSQIINELIDSEKSINGALLKTKVLASRIQNFELLNWVNFELTGYDSVKNLPNYRKKIHNDLKGNFINGNMKYTNNAIPTMGMDEEFEELIWTTDFLESIVSLENLIADVDAQSLTSPLRAEIVSLIQDNWRDMGNPYLQIISINKIITKSAIHGIISNVRNRLLDFMLKIDEKFGNITEINELKKKKKEIGAIMNKTIINTTGDGNIINTGNKSKVDAKIDITKEELKEQLENAGLSEQDSSELISIIDDEVPNFEKKTFGTKVNIWTKKMLGKALDGSWNIGVGTAGNLLAEIISKYYGM